MKDLSRAFVATAIIQLVNIASGVLLARILMAEGRGELAAAMLWPGIVGAIGVLGIHEAVVYHASRRSRGENTVLFSALVLAAGLSAVSAAVAFVVIDIVLAGYRDAVISAARWYVLFIPLNYIGLCCVALFQGVLRLDEWNVLRTVVHVAYTVFIVLFFLVGWTSITAFVIAALAANVVLIALALALMAPRGWLKPAPPVLVGDVAAFGARAHAGSLVNAFSTQLDQLVLSVVGGGLALGLYVVANTVARLVSVPALTLASLAVTKVGNAADPAARRAVFGRYLRTALALSVAGAAAVALAGEWIIALFFGSGFAGSVPLVPVLALAAACLGAKAVLAAGLKGLGQPLAVARGEAAGLGALAVALVVLVPGHGAMGAAVAATLGQAVGTVGMVLFARRTVGGGWAALFRPQGRDVREFTALFRRG